MLNKEKFKDLKEARTLKRSKGLMHFRSSLSQRTVAVGLSEGGDGKLKCSDLRVAHTRSNSDSDEAAVLEQQNMTLE